jgi:hypothetical protein
VALDCKQIHCVRERVTDGEDDIQEAVLPKVGAHLEVHSEVDTEAIQEQARDCSRSFCSCGISSRSDTRRSLRGARI